MERTEQRREVEESAVSHDDDRVDLERVARGDRAALGALYDRHAGAVFRHALWTVGRVEDAEDVVQTVFVRLAERGGGGIGSLRSYLAAAAHRAAIDVLRARRRRRESPEVEVDALIGACGGPADDVADREWAAQVARLPPEQREVVVLRAWGEFSFREIGRVVGVTTWTAASRWRLAIGRLRRSVAADGRASGRTR